MLVAVMFCMMKMAEIATGKPVIKQRKRHRHRMPNRKRGKVMGEMGLGVRLGPHSPDSDCNSNRPESTTSCLSNTSSQDIDFVQDNSDYQWFLDYNYRDGSTNHHTSILSLTEPYESNDIGYYETLAKNMDANLAEADMESFRTEDIHALLTNLPTMCSDPLSQESNRQGESFASVSGSMMAKFDFDSSISPRSSSQGDESSMSICKSELLFSPVKEVPPAPPGGTISVDSLDCGLDDILLTCQANKDNYTIAFEGSMTMYSEDSDYHVSEKTTASATGSSHWSSDLRTQMEVLKRTETSMAQSDSGGFTTWSKLTKRNSENQLRRHPSGNNNSSVDTSNAYTTNENALKSQSMPNLYKQKLRERFNTNYLRNQSVNAHIDLLTLAKRRPVKVFDIHHQVESGSSVSSDMATSADGASSGSESKHPNFNLVKLFMKQKSMSAEGMSTAMDQSSLSENWPTQSEGSESLEEKPKTDLLFEDSLLVESHTNGCNRTNAIIEEQDEDVSHSESVEQISESSKFDSCDELLETTTRTHNNCNNNHGGAHIRLKMHGTQTKNASSSSVDTTTSMSSFSLADSERAKAVGKTTATQIPVHLMNRSIQTSAFVDKSLKQAPYKLNCNNVLRDTVKVIQPSFLNKLKKEETPKPVYVLYPNYVLPNLDFLNQKQDDLTKVFLLPQKPETTTTNKRRPFSCNDVETLKRKGFGHVRDWDSLNLLLPAECQQILADVPELSQHLNARDELFKRRKPSFCASPPARRRRRPISCDCSPGLERTGSSTTTNTSSSSSQPSSGYRGSSTLLLTDSQSTPSNHFNPLFVYRYDSVTSSEASMMSERPTISTAPPLPKRSISLAHEKKLEATPPRPPLPKGILRKSLENAKLRKNQDNLKRYSSFDAEDEVNEVTKRYSLPEYTRNKRLSETEDEGVDAGTSSSSLDEQVDSSNLRVPTPPHPKTELLLSNISCDELVQLEEYLKMSGFSASDTEELTEEGVLHLRTCVSKFLSLKINQESGEHFGGKKSVSFAEKVNILSKNRNADPPNNSPNASAFLQPKYQLSKPLTAVTISEEAELTRQATPTRLPHSDAFEQKRALISAVTDAVEKLICHFAPATTQSELIALGDSTQNPASVKLALTTLCPALYAILSDGLKPNLETSFGPIGNSVWQVVEAAAQQGPLTKALNELVMRINGEDVITEGVVKFNAFVFGLLNVRSLDAWLNYLKTRESVLRKHYGGDALMLLAHTGGVAIRSLIDSLVEALEPLSLLPFQFDLLFEYRQLHRSLKRIDSYQQQPPTSPTHLLKQLNLIKLAQSMQSNSDDDLSAATIKRVSPDDPSLPDLLNSSLSRSPGRNKTRPRSYVEPCKTNFRLGEEVAQKRWSGIAPSSKLYQAYNRLAREDEEYTDSLENNCERVSKVAVADGSSKGSMEEIPPIRDEGPESLDSNLSDEKPLNGRRFKRLQQKWEMLSGRESSSESPPPSPTHKSKIPRPVTSPVRPSGIPVPVVSPTSKIPTKKPITPCATKKTTTKVGGGDATKRPGMTRVSRLDQLEQKETIKHVTRPSSLPYKPASVPSNKAGKVTPPRRAVSSSLGRKPVPTPRVVRTLSHRLPSESGHLPFNEGDRLKLIFEVDEKWLLCCKGTRKGLVPRAAVIPEQGRF